MPFRCCQVVFVGFSLVVLGLIMVVLGILVGRSAVMVLRPGHVRLLLLGFWMSSFFFLGILLHRVLVCLQGLCLFVTFLTILLVKFLLGAYLGMAVLIVFLPLGDWFRVVLVLCLVRWVVRVFAWVVILVEVLKESDYTGKHQHTLLDKVFREVQVRPRIWKRLRDPLVSDSSFPGAKFLRVHLEVGGHAPGLDRAGIG